MILAAMILASIEGHRDPGTDLGFCASVKIASEEYQQVMEPRRTDGGLGRVLPSLAQRGRTTFWFIPSG
jgi:hypothetical protein